MKQNKTQRELFAFARVKSSVDLCMAELKRLDGLGVLTKTETRHYDIIHNHIGDMIDSL